MGAAELISQSGRDTTVGSVACYSAKCAALSRGSGLGNVSPTLIGSVQTLAKRNPPCSHFPKRRVKHSGQKISVTSRPRHFASTTTLSPKNGMKLIKASIVKGVTKTYFVE